MDHAGWYDRNENTFRQLVDIQFIAAMGPPGGGRTQITQRYVRHFNLLNFVPFNDVSLKRVFTTILDWTLSKGFDCSVQSLSGATVDATIAVYRKISTELLPTPTKSFYTFNLRDLSKVIQGLSMVDASTIVDRETFVRLWCHESLRVFHDRLINDNDRRWFFDELGHVVNEKFNLDFHEKIHKKDDGFPIIFGSYLDYTALPEKRLYREVPGEESLQAAMQHFLREYNSNCTNRMSLVLFLNAMEHISRIARIINQPYGNALLMGVGGSGRKSLTTLAVSVCGFEFAQIEISSSYGRNEWCEDLKRIFLKAGAEGGGGNPTVFVFDDSHIVYESFLEDINLILNTGEVPNLFTSEDLSAINDTIAKTANAAGVNTANSTEMYKFFISRCRANLHVVICLSPIGDAFRRRLRMFPALVSCTTIDWFTAWPKDALRSVANHFLGEEDMDENTKNGVVDVCVDMQERVSAMSDKYLAQMGRYFYVTPTSYLELINTFKKLLAKQRSQVTEMKLRYDNGLEKILSTETQVDGMQKHLVALQPELKQATIDTDALVETIKVERFEANEVEAVVNTEREACNKQKAEAEQIATSCQKDLAQALPALEAALTALKSLKQSDISEIKAMKKPPDAVKLVLEAVCLMMAVKPDKVKEPGSIKKVDDYWGPAQKHLLGDPKFLSHLVSYDRDNMDPAMVERVVEYTKKDQFQVEVVKKASIAAAGLCKWVCAMMLYDRVAREVAPKKAALTKAEEALTTAQEELADKESALKEVQDKLALLQSRLDAANAKKVELQGQVTDCATKLDRAEQLIKGLGGEKARWTQLSKSFEAKFTNVTGDILLSSGVIAYLGAFVVSYRQDALYEWSSLLERVGIPCTEGFALRSTLGDEVQIREYVINKLPNDEFSVENAIMLERSNRWPLMIDPQGQANNWVKKTYGEQLKVVKLSSQTFARTIENAIPFGHPVLIENVGAQLDPVLEPLLQKQIVVTGGVPQMRFGDATLEYNDAFRLFITTKMRNPHYPPELCVKVTLLNFCATAEGLEDQMLGLAVACEEAELEAQREKLILEDAENKRALAEIEDKILHLLRTSEGNILDDENLIEVLKESKIKSKKIEERVKDAAKTAEIIAQTRKGYQSLAFHASQLFFTIADLSAIDPMYQYSMEWFQALFIDAIGKESDEKSGGPSPSLEERITALKDRFTHVLYLNVCRSLFEKDKLLFSFLLTVKIMIGDLKLDPAHLRYFLAGNTSLEQRELPETECGWLDEQTWSQILGLSKLTGFEDFLDGHFLNQLESWRAIYESKSPIDDIRALFGTTVDEKSAANLSMVEASETRSSKAGGRPSSVSGDPVVDEEERPEAFLSAPFQQLLMLRSIRPDAVVPAIQSFVAYEMGKRFIEVPQFDLEACYNDSKCHTPLLFVLTPGADPMSALYKLAEEKGFIGKKLHAISLGQGQGDIAYQAISEAQDKGTWVCLQNCHLCISWMPTLERLCEELSPDRIQADFRLWLTSEPSKHFPAYILQNGLKMTLEPPKGVRANLIGSYSSMIAPDFMEGTARDAEFRKLLFGLCFFHASVRERRKFGPLGWNISYVFSGSDLRISMDQLRIFCVDLAPEEEIPYAALRYLTGECNYGGRVTDDKDRRCLANMLTDFYSQDVVKDDHYKFSPSGTYFAPADGASYMDYILSLPYSEGPELFGLHDNANISCALGETNLLLSTALSLQPRSTGGAGFKSWDETFAEISRGIEAKLPAQFDLEKAVIDFPVLYEESMNTVLTQELLRFNKLTGVIKRSLKEAQRAIKGLVVMSGDLEAMGNSMVDGHVPIEWSTAAYPSRKPLGSWVVDLLQRLDFLRAWSEAKMAPKVFWISGFFFTQAFITGTLQNYARKYQLPIDTVAFDFAFLTPTQEELAYEVGPEDGSICRGLFLEGARWDVPNHVLAESKPRELHTAVPLFHLLPKPKADIEPVAGRPELYTGEIAGTAHVYMCPIYKESTRQGVLSTTGHSTNFVMYIRVPMAKDHDQKHWIKRGVAMLTQKDV